MDSVLQTERVALQHNVRVTHSVMLQCRHALLHDMLHQSGQRHVCVQLEHNWGCCMVWHMQLSNMQSSITG